MSDYEEDKKSIVDSSAEIGLTNLIAKLKSAGKTDEQIEYEKKWYADKLENYKRKEEEERWQKKVDMVKQEADRFNTPLKLIIGAIAMAVLAVIGYFGLK